MAVLRNVNALALGTLLMRVGALVLISSLARMEGAAGVGLYASAQAFAAYFLFVSDFGVTPLVTREAAADATAVARLYRAAVGLKLMLVVVALVGAVLLLELGPLDSPLSRMLLAMLIGATIIQSFAYLDIGLFRAAERMSLEAISTAAYTSASLAVGVPLILFGKGALSLGFAALAASVTQLVVTAVLRRRLVKVTGVRLPSPSLFLNAAPYAATSFTHLAFVQIDIIILTFIISPGVLGQYTSITRVLFLLATLSRLVSVATLPALTRGYASRTGDAFREINERALLLSVAAGSLLGGVVVLFAPVLLLILYGRDFVELARLLEISAAYLVFRHANAQMSTALTASGQQARRAVAVIVGVAATVTLVVPLSIAFGLVGVVTAFVASELVLLSTYAVLSRSVLSLSGFREAALMAVPFFLGLATHLALGRGAVGFVSGASVFVACVLVLGLHRRALGAIQYLTGVTQSVHNATSTATAGHAD